MIQYLDDSHTFLYSPDEEYMIHGEGENFYSSGSDQDEVVEQEFSLELLKDKYVENINDFSEGEYDIYFSGKVKGKNIGYIYFDDIGTANHGKMDELLEGTDQYDAIIMDLRHNGGGNDLTARAFASRFSDNEDLTFTVQERTGPKHNDFSEKILYHSPKADGRHYDKHVIVLTDNFTVSGAEIFIWYMKSYANVTIMGDYSSGDFSDTSMRRFLPNGWQYQYSIMMFLSPEGETLDGKGHTPDVYVRNSKEDIQAGNDIVMEGAIQYIKDTYDIE
jgi:C-terminal processing protease CtpA/Prc